MPKLAVTVKLLTIYLLQKHWQKQQINLSIPMTYLSVNLIFSLSPSNVTFVAFDKNWKFDTSTEVCELIPIDTTSASVPSHELLSPDGEKTAFIRNYNIWIRDIKSGEEYALTQDGEPHYSYGTIPEARDLIKGLHDVDSSRSNPFEAIWSPDSLKLFTFQLDERQVRKMPSILHVPQNGTIAPRIVERKYALPGDKNIARYRMLVIDIETTKETSAQYPPIEDSFVSLCPFNGNRAWWSNNSSCAYFIDMTRGQKIARLIKFDTQTGETTKLFEEISETYLELGLEFERPAMIKYLSDKNELIWYSERTGWAHLYLFDLSSGKLKNAVTSGNWRIRDIVHFDNKSRELYIQITGRIPERNPYYRELVRVNIDNAKMTVLASGNYDYFTCPRPGDKCGISPSHQYIVATRSRVDEPPVTELRDRNGELLFLIESTDISNLPDKWQWPESVSMKAADNKTIIYGVVFRPSYFDPNKTYPVLDLGMDTPFYSCIPTGPVYTGGGTPTANYFYMTCCALAELGFIVTTIDGRGSPFRSKEFHNFGYKSFMNGGGMIDHVVGIKQLANQHPSMDLNKVGLVSTDGPGNGSIFGLLHYPEFYKVGVAFSMWDPRLVKQGEVYHGLIEDHDNEQYSWNDIAKNLQGKLLLITGLLDRYFHCSMTFQLIDALGKANRDFDLLIQPNGGHGYRVKHAHRRVWDYLTRHMLNSEPPQNFVLQTGFEKLAPNQMLEKEML